MSFPRYASYKPSGVGWLRDVPGHWQIVQSRRLFSERKERARPDEQQLTASQKHGIVFQSHFMALEGQKVVQVIHGTDILKHVEPDDFVISMRSFQGGIEHSLERGCISSAYVMLVPDSRIYPHFFKYLFKSQTYIRALQSTTNLIRDGQALRFENFAKVPLPLMDRDEQRAIAAFLDREIAKIDALVDEQKRLIELLKEKRRAVISHAVSKGLDPHAPMKDSGVQWLGQVPEHWRVSQLRYNARLGTSITYGIVQAGPDVEGGIPYIRTSDMTHDRLPEDGYLRTSPEIDATYARSRVFEGDVVIAIRATIGKPLIVPKYLNGANLTQGTAKFSPSASILAEYICYFLRSSNAETEFARLGKGATFKEITLDMLRKFAVPLPSVTEQRQIVDRLKKETSDLDGLIAAARQAAVLLAERRSALISAAVTGKIDVRGVATEIAEAAA